MSRTILVLPNDDLENINGLFEIIENIGGAFDLILIGDSGYLQESNFKVPDKIQSIHHFHDLSMSQPLGFGRYSKSLAEFIKQQSYSLVISSANEDSNVLLPSVSTVLDGSCMTDITSLNEKADRFYVTRFVYNMNIIAEFELCRRPVIVSTSHRSSTSKWVPIKFLKKTNHFFPATDENWFSGLESETITEVDGLRNAKKVLVAGRGVSGKKGYDKVAEISKLLNAKTGTTRPLVQEGIAANHEMVGSSGVIVSPEKCLIFGSSGAAPFAFGIDKSQIIFGVNNDPESQLFRFCDYGIIDDCSLIISELLKLLQPFNG
ncbi:MAG: electron transfer flavoprotein subunit alpha/FixB family protein [Clostridiaceae bacterium]|jgi:electron transfer flavoprotein alpha subunit|nr:electron transfer flavoprotein subunit alpha/FixB family protein [Clostridiaceae bacterium]